MTCKDCIHYDVCSDWENICNKMSLFSTIKKEVCKDFKDKSKIIELPCKVGDTVYDITWNGRIRTCKILMICQKMDGAWKIQISPVCSTMFYAVVVDAIGKTVFLTREEAEQALRERDLK